MADDNNTLLWRAKMAQIHGDVELSDALKAQVTASQASCQHADVATIVAPQDSGAIKQGQTVTICNTCVKLLTIDGKPS